MCTTSTSSSRSPRSAPSTPRPCRSRTHPSPRLSTRAPASAGREPGRDAEEAFLGTLRENAKASLDAALASMAEVPATGEMLEGDTVDELAALDDREIDLLVCGSRGYGPVRRVLLGGVSSRLIRRVACPVVVVPRCADLTRGCPAGHRSTRNGPLGGAPTRSQRPA
ncbi:MAG: universal stress protein [Solirubrobacteraceae bacterium]